MRLWTAPIRLLVLTLLLAAQPAIAQMGRAGGRDCALCHLEWTSGFSKPGAVLLIDKPQRSTASDARSCLGCHDGSVADSRCNVWLQAGHQPGAAPPAGMTIPPDLPLDDGKITCRTCHTAHATGSSAGLADTIFLRMKNDRGQLCAACHGEQAKGPQAGSHPLAKMPTALPRQFREAGVHSGEDGKQMSCQSCHVAHGGADRNLLLPAAAGSDLCRDCHQQIKPEMWKSGAHEHALNVPVKNAAQRDAVAKMGGQLGPGDTLVCRSCHAVHKAPAKQSLLNVTLENSKLCIQCHADRAQVAGSSHDLRKSAPAELNTRKQTASQAGPCSACHAVHSYARVRTACEGDPQGVCVTCHSANQVAAKHTGLPLSHPGEVDQQRLAIQPKLTLYPSKDDPTRKALACATCHDPHETRRPDYLRQDREQLCADCHADKVRSLAGAHDLSSTNARNAFGRSGADAGKCGFCHAVHNAKGPVMWAATPEAPASVDETCTACHRKDGMASKSPAALFSHPTASAHPATATRLPLFAKDGRLAPIGSGTGQMSCGTCHDPHVSTASSKSMLRATAKPSLCAECHPDDDAMAGGPHDRAHASKPWPIANPAARELCSNCHVPHSNDPTRQTWAFATAGDATGPDRACLACHADHRWAADDADIAPGQTIHPFKASAKFLKLGLTDLNLVSSRPQAPPDTLACKTCHNPHAGKHNAGLLRTGRDRTPGQLCTTCHAQQHTIQFSRHARELVSAGNPAAGECGPCHSPHAKEQSRRPLLWSAGLDPSSPKDAEQRCLACHGPGGEATHLDNWRHPPTESDRSKAPTTRPVDGDTTILPPMSELTCATCHLTHGRLPSPPLSSGTTQAEIRASWKLLLRNDVEQKTCATCHGVDAPRMFLYFHKPRLRESAKRLAGP